MDYKKTTIMILIFILISPITSKGDIPLIGASDPVAASALGIGHKVSDFNPSVDDWYAVEDWEIEYCRKWGGSEQGAINQGATSKTPIALSQLTITIQGEKLEYDIEGQLQVYKASWYIEPVSDELEFTVSFIGDGTQEIGRGIASNTDAGFGYYTDYINKSFTHVKLEFPGNYLEVPIVS